MTDPNCVDPNQVRKSKTKTKMSLKESAAHLAASPHIRNLAIMVSRVPKFHEPNSKLHARF
jgi:ATP/ADP translocase